MYCVYFLQSLKQKRFYIGVTRDLANRVKQHNNGHTKSTCPYKRWILIHFESYSEKKVAYKREYYLKHPQGYLEKELLLRSINMERSHSGLVHTLGKRASSQGDREFKSLSLRHDRL